MKSPLDLSLYLVTHRGSLAADDFFHKIHQAIEGGVTVVQLREKEASARDMVAIGKRLHALLKPLGIPLIINDRVDIAHAIQAEGVHLGQSDLSVAEARAILGKEAILGLSVETMAQVINAEGEEIDYLAASPVFRSATKLDCSPPWGLEGLKAIYALSKHPLIAIGGIDETNVEDIMLSGAVGAAVVSAIFQAPCPKTAAMILKRKISNIAHSSSL